MESKSLLKILVDSESIFIVIALETLTLLDTSLGKNESSGKCPLKCKIPKVNIEKRFASISSFKALRSQRSRDIRSFKEIVVGESVPDDDDFHDE